MADTNQDKKAPAGKVPGKSGPGKAAAPLAAQMARLLAKAQAEAIAPLELAPAQFTVLRELWKGDGLTQAELVRRLAVEQATMANTLKRMVRDGLVTTARHPEDRRARCLRLTDRARELEKPAKAAVKQVNARAVDGLSRKEQKRLVDLTRRVITSLQVDASAPEARPPQSP